MLLSMLGMFSGTFAGLLLVGNLAPYALSKGLAEEMTVLSVVLFSLGNLSGRIIWGHIFDKTGYRVIPWSLLLASLFYMLLRFAPGGFVFMASVLVLGFFVWLPVCALCRVSLKDVRGGSILEALSSGFPLVWTGRYHCPPVLVAGFPIVLVPTIPRSYFAWRCCLSRGWSFLLRIGSANYQGKRDWALSFAVVLIPVSNFQVSFPFIDNLC